jgi:hypothetical protein
MHVSAKHNLELVSSLPVPGDLTEHQRKTCSILSGESLHQASWVQIITAVTTCSICAPPPLDPNVKFAKQDLHVRTLHMHSLVLARANAPRQARKQDCDLLIPRHGRCPKVERE